MNEQENPEGRYAHDGQSADVEGHVRRPHMLDEDTGPSSPFDAVDAGAQDDGPDVEGHGHTFHHHKLAGPSES